MEGRACLTSLEFCSRSLAFASERSELPSQPTRAAAIPCWAAPRVPSPIRAGPDHRADETEHDVGAIVVDHVTTAVCDGQAAGDREVQPLA